MLTVQECTFVLLYDIVLFSLFNIKSFDIYLLQLDVQSARKPSLFQQNYCFSKKKKKTLMRYAK